VGLRGHGTVLLFDGRRGVRHARTLAVVEWMRNGDRWCGRRS
jgi:hypothetical protein